MKSQAWPSLSRRNGPIIEGAVIPRGHGPLLGTEVRRARGPLFFNCIRALSIPNAIMKQSAVVIPGPSKLVSALLAWTFFWSLGLVQAPRAWGCPFCNAVSQTLRQEMAAMDAVVIAEAAQSDATRDKATGDVLMRVTHVLKNNSLVKVGDEVNATYYGDVVSGRQFMLSGVDPPELLWSCLPLSDKAATYVKMIPELAEDPVERLKFYYGYLQDNDSMLSRDAYDEFAVAPYDVILKLKPEVDRDELVGWLNEPELPTDRKRLYLTLLGVVGDESHLPMLEKRLRSTQKSTRGGLDALIACYLTLAGEPGLPLINELFLSNEKASYADTYSAIMAIRFHGTEGDVIARSALMESLHPVLDRPDLADLVIPDLARWKDWSLVDRMVRLFTESDPENNWVRVPVVNYLRACPLPAADEALAKLAEMDPESVRRANAFFSIPVPARDVPAGESSIPRPVPRGEGPARVPPIAPPVPAMMIPTASRVTGALGGRDLAANFPLMTPEPSAVSPVAMIAPSAMNRWRLAGVMGLALVTFVVGQFLVLSGGGGGRDDRFRPEPSRMR